MKLKKVKEEMKHCRDYTLIDWSYFVKYDENSPTGLSYLKDNNVAGRMSSKRNIEEGRTGWVLSFNSSRWLVHRVIACLELGGVTQKDVVDHIDGNPFNNVLSNLRVTNQSTNLKNKRKQSNNTSGINGVGVYYTPNGRAFVLATYKSEGVSETKYFSVFNNEEGTLEKGREWLLQKQLSDGLFTERHGK